MARRNRDLGSLGTMFQSAASTAVAAFGKDGGKKAFKNFQNLIGKLFGGDGNSSPKKHLGEELRQKGGWGNGD